MMANRCAKGGGLIIPAFNGVSDAIDSRTLPERINA